MSNYPSFCAQLDWPEDKRGCSGMLADFFGRKPEEYCKNCWFNKDSNKNIDYTKINDVK